VDFVRRWGFFGRIIPRARPVALESSCAHCYYAFVAHNDGQISKTAHQSAHDDLLKLQTGIDSAQGKDRNNTSNEDKPVARPPSPRPAPDPRARRK
jgi:hypothetical protein